MAETPLDTAPENPYATLIKLVWGSNTRRYARWDDDVTVGSDTYVSPGKSDDGAHLLSIEFAELRGIVEDDIVTIRAPQSLAPFDGLSNGFAHATVKATISEVVPGTDATFREIYFGRIRKARRDPAGDVRIVECEVHGIKSRLQVNLGMRATTTCAWPLGHPTGCKVDRDALDVTQTINGLSVDGEPTRISAVKTPFSFTGTASEENVRYANGAVVVDGLRLRIRQISEIGASNVEFDLSRQPPASWLNASATFVQGCDKRIETCRAVYSNEANFGGFGFAMPDRNPVFETS